MLEKTPTVLGETPTVLGNTPTVLGIEKRKIGFFRISFLKLLEFFRAIFLCARRVEARKIGIFLREFPKTVGVGKLWRRIFARAPAFALCVGERDGTFGQHVLGEGFEQGA